LIIEVQFFELRKRKIATHELETGYMPLSFHHLPQLNITHHLVFYFLVEAKVGELSAVTSDRSAAFQAERLNRQKNPEAVLKLTI
jgi:hypothetical protein